MIKVTMKKDSNGYRTTEKIPMEEVLKTIFPDKKIESTGYRREIEGVTFNTTRPGSTYYPSDAGIEMSFYDHEFHTVRRAQKLTKNGEIDDDKIRAKFQELLSLKKQSDEYFIAKRKNKENREDYYKKARELVGSDYKHNLSAESDNSVRISLRVTAEQALAIKELLEN